MMDLPKVGTTYVQARRGIAAVQNYAAAKGLIWRETGTGDVGIDGQLEFVNPDGFATGRTIAMQVKAGPSFFQRLEILSRGKALDLLGAISFAGLAGSAQPRKRPNLLDRCAPNPEGACPRGARLYQCLKCKSS